MAKNKQNAKTKTSRFNAEMADEAGNRNTDAKNTKVNINEQNNK